MSNVSKKYNVIGIAVSGQDKDNLKITHFVSILGDKSIENLNRSILLKLDELNNAFTAKAVKVNYNNT